MQQLALFDDSDFPKGSGHVLSGQQEPDKVERPRRRRRVRWEKIGDDYYYGKCGTIVYEDGAWAVYESEFDRPPAATFPTLKQAKDFAAAQYA